MDLNYAVPLCIRVRNVSVKLTFPAVLLSYSVSVDTVPSAHHALLHGGTGTRLHCPLTQRFLFTVTPVSVLCDV